MKDLIDPLVRALVAGSQDDVHFILESRTGPEGQATLFTLGKPALQHSYSTLVNDAVAESSYRLLQAYQAEQGDQFSGFEMLLEVQDGHWKVAMHTLNDGDSSWAGLPRVPVRLVGHGYSLAPPPGRVYRWAQVSNPVGIVAAMHNQQGQWTQAEVRLSPGQKDLQIKVNPPELDWQALVELCEGPQLQEWWVEVRGFRFLWPAGVDLSYPVSTGKQVELLGKNGSLLYLQGPLKPGLVDLNDMGAADQRETARGGNWVEFAYVAEGQNWRQRHHLKECGPYQVVITAQAPSDCADEIFELATRVNQNLLPPTF